MVQAFKNCFKYTDLNGAEIERTDVYQRERTIGSERIALGPAGSCKSLVRELIAIMAEPVFLLLVLTVSRRDRQVGRYQSKLMTTREADAFLAEFGEFLDRDARQQLWIGTPDGSSLIVWDRHQIVYAYGHIDRVESVAQRLGFTHGRVGITAPHCHQYHPLFDDTEEEILDRFEWRWSDLHDGDDE